MRIGGGIGIGGSIGIGGGMRIGGDMRLLQRFEYRICRGYKYWSKINRAFEKD